MPSTAASSNTLSEETAIRLFNSVVATGGETGGARPLAPAIQRLRGSTTSTKSTDMSKSVESVHSANEFGHSCRICRWNRSDMQILRCPCHCKGSVGFIHLQCLRRWILHRRDNHCEICNACFDMPDEKLNVRRMFGTFMCSRCCGAIAKHLLLSVSLAPLAHIVLQQLLLCMEKINQSPNDQLTVQEVLLASCALLTSSALFFHFFEFVTTRFLMIRNIMRQWWMFGSASNFSLVEMDSDIFEAF